MTRLLVALLALGLLVRLALAATVEGIGFDLQSMDMAERVLRNDALDLYAQLNNAAVGARWPYPPGFFPALLVARQLAELTGAEFIRVVRLPAILADLAIAWLVQDHLRRHGADVRRRLAGAGLVVLGPVLFFVSADHGHFDAVAFLGAVAGVVAWERARPERRALYAGLLIGAGAAVKTVPIVVVLALLPLAASRREAVTLVGAAVAVPLALLVPWLVADPGGTVDALRYEGRPGLGGLSLLVQPALAVDWLTGAPFAYSGATELLQDVAPALTVAGVALTTIVLFRAKPAPAVGAALLILTLWVFGGNYFVHYAAWGVPFFVMAGWLRATAIFQAVYLVPLVIYYGRGPLADNAWDERVVWGLYVPVMLALWVAACVLLGRELRRAAERRSPGPPAQRAASPV